MTDGPYDGEQMFDLNAAVTAAILEAERARSVESWSRVKELEVRLSTEAETEMERAIALHGIETAADQIRALQGQASGPGAPTGGTNLFDDESVTHPNSPLETALDFAARLGTRSAAFLQDRVTMIQERDARIASDMRNRCADVVGEAGLTSAAESIRALPLSTGGDDV